MVEENKYYQYELTDKRIAYPTKGICKVLKVQKAPNKGLFRAGVMVYIIQALDLATNSLLSVGIRLSDDQISFGEEYTIPVTLQDYFLQEFAEGKTDFCLRVVTCENNIPRFYIRPDSKNGQTKNLEVIGNSLISIT